MTIIECIDTTAKRFHTADLVYGHGTDNAWDEATWLVLHAIDQSPTVPIKNPQQQLTQEQQQRIEALVSTRICKRIPNAYLTQQTWYCGLPFYVDQRTLIPRSPIAELIQCQFMPWLNTPPRHILDLGTGSGCIAIACAYAFPEAKITAADISKDALTVAQRNVENHGLTQRVKLVQSDIFTNIDGRFDVIISNPPYVSAEEMSTLGTEYQHEPELALDAGVDGLNIIRPILQHAKHHLSDHGLLIVEVGDGKAVLEHTYPQLPFIWPELEAVSDCIFLLNASELSNNA